MRVLFTIIGLLILNSVFATEQTPDVLIYKDHKIFIENFPLEVRVEKDSILDAKLDKIECLSTDCWRHVIGIWKIENDSLFLVGLVEPCEHQKLPLDNFFDNTEIKNNKVFANWYSEKIEAGYGKYLGFSNSDWKNIYDNEIKLNFKNGIVTDVYQQNPIKDKLLGAWGNDELGNAVFAFYPDSMYYPDANLWYKYSIISDTIRIEKENKNIEKVQVVEINDETVKLNYLDYEIIETYNKRK